MSLDSSPSQRPSGGWSSPGLSAPLQDGLDGGRLRSASPAMNDYADSSGGHGVTWASAKANSARVNGYPPSQSTYQAFQGHLRSISQTLPFFSQRRHDDRLAEKEKLQRGRNGGRDWGDYSRYLGFLASKRRRVVTFVTLFMLILVWFWSGTLLLWYRKSAIGYGGSKFVIILGANEEGGVMDWKGAREWAIERDSVRNKKRYAARWGYELEIVDMSTKKKYSHEWRESWEKVDIIRNTMGKYPHAEWFWWLDLNTVVMEPSYPLQSHVFKNLAEKTYRDINLNNPLHIPHPPNGTSGDSTGDVHVNYLDPVSLSPVGDGKAESIDLILTQDCSGFNLGSFFLRRSAWSDRLLDLWWDPVFYEQRHMDWEHKEQDALEYLYTNQPWVRTHTAFLPQRRINAFPPNACGDDRGLPDKGCDALQWGEDPQECGLQGVHYQERERDFLVNMAGCQWGRDCWEEIYTFREKSNHLNRTRWEKFKDWLSEMFKRNH